MKDPSAPFYLVTSYIDDELRLLSADWSTSDTRWARIGQICYSSQRSGYVHVVNRERSGREYLAEVMLTGSAHPGVGVRCSHISFLIFFCLSYFLIPSFLLFFLFLYSFVSSFVNFLLPFIFSFLPSLFISSFPSSFLPSFLSFFPSFFVPSFLSNMIETRRFGAGGAERGTTNTASQTQLMIFITRARHVHTKRSSRKVDGKRKGREEIAHDYGNPKKDLDCRDKHNRPFVDDVVGRWANAEFQKSVSCHRHVQLLVLRISVILCFCLIWLLK